MVCPFSVAKVFGSSVLLANGIYDQGQTADCKKNSCVMVQTWDWHMGLMLMIGQPSDNGFSKPLSLLSGIIVITNKF